VQDSLATPERTGPIRFNWHLPLAARQLRRVADIRAAVRRSGKRTLVHPS